MKALIIGYGSIGRRHDEVISSLGKFSYIDLVTKQDIVGRVCFKSINEVLNINSYDYFVIASETIKHYEQLCYLEEVVTKKLILCEKPLFSICSPLEVKNNSVYVGYTLRFHPLLIRLREMITDEQIIYVNVKCGQYLPHWRPNTDYRKCYSAKKSLGGGVLLDLSHEIDYIYWLLGKITVDFSIQTKISDLEIDSDDLTFFCGKSKDGAFFNVSLDYLSKVPYRFISLHTNEKSYEVDLVGNSITIAGKDGVLSKTAYSDCYRNYIYEQMHRSILNDKKHVSNFNDGIFVMKVIKEIQEKSI